MLFFRGRRVAVKETPTPVIISLMVKNDFRDHRFGVSIAGKIIAGINFVCFNLKPEQANKC